jgi:type VI secretion system FHA domain protein
VEAFTDAFEDLKHHQLAMLEGMRMAFEAMLAEFDPDRLQAQFDQQLSKGSLISKPAKLRYWDLYRDFCKAMLKDKEANFLKLFGEEFASAYDEQFRRLKADGRTRTDRTDKPPFPER